MSRLTDAEAQMLLRWFLYRADRATLDRARAELPVFFHKAWKEYVVRDYGDTNVD